MGQADNQLAESKEYVQACKYMYINQACKYMYNI